MDIAELNRRIRADIPSVGAMRLKGVSAEVAFTGRHAVGDIPAERS